MGVHSIHCATCGYWMHGPCSGVRGSLARVAQGFVCKVVFELRIEGQRNRGRPVKRWTDVVEEDMKKRGVVQQDAGDREGWRRRAVKGLANSC